MVERAAIISGQRPQMGDAGAGHTGDGVMAQIAQDATFNVRLAINSKEPPPAVTAFNHEAAKSNTIDFAKAEDPLTQAAAAGATYASSDRSIMNRSWGNGLPEYVAQEADRKTFQYT